MFISLLAAGCTDSSGSVFDEVCACVCFKDPRLSLSQAVWTLSASTMSAH